jgi:hypothetical protein
VLFICQKPQENGCRGVMATILNGDWDILEREEAEAVIFVEEFVAREACVQTQMWLRSSEARKRLSTTASQPIQENDSNTLYRS